jgi:hypothetical protein
MDAITVDWPATTNEHGRPMLWFGSWLSGGDGSEGSWFYSGRGGDKETYPVPKTAIGLRIRRWPNEGLDAEYVDLTPLDGLAHVSPESLDFDALQPFSPFTTRQEAANDHDRTPRR